MPRKPAQQKPKRKLSKSELENRALRIEVERLRSRSVPAPVVMAPILDAAPTFKLDLGSGPRPADGFKGVDIVPGQTDYTFDLCSGERWPFDDNSVDELRSSHFIEHIDAVCVHRLWDDRLDALLFFLDEAFRIAKPGATFTIQWPALQSVRAFQDPTHRRFIPAEQTMYWCVDGRKAMGVEHYGAKCNWIGGVTPTIRVPPPGTPEELANLRYEEIRAKEASRRYHETWNYAEDFIATLKAVK